MICPYKCDEDCIETLLSEGLLLSIGCVVISLMISLYLIIRHLMNFNMPFFQSKIISIKKFFTLLVILMMAPFYGLISIMSMEFHGLASYFELVRDIYLAFLLFTFFYLMFSYLAYNPDDKLLYDDRVYETMIEHEKEIHHLWPVNYCTERYLLTTKAKAKYFTYRCKKFVLQYCVVKPVLTILIIVLHPFHHKLYAQRLMSSFEFIIITSETFSLYYLILFYYALKHPLQPYKPLLKFLIIKITLFFTFWQSLTLSIFEEEISSCFEPDEAKYSNATIISAIENTLVCIEMLCMTLASIFAFTYTEFISEDENKVGTLGQVLTDNWKAFQHDFRLIKPKKFGFISKVHEIEMHNKRISGNQEFEVTFTGDYQRLSKAIDVQYI